MSRHLFFRGALPSLSSIISFGTLIDLLLLLLGFTSQTKKEREICLHFVSNLFRASLAILETTIVLSFLSSSSFLPPGCCCPLSLVARHFPRRSNVHFLYKKKTERNGMAGPDHSRRSISCCM